MEELPPELKVRSFKELDLSLSVEDWLTVCDSLEEVARRKWEGGETSSKKPEWVPEQQMADQIRQYLAEEPWEEY